MRLVHLIHSMGGSIRKDTNSKVTHLICNAAMGDKYQYAMTFRLAVVRPNWVVDAWNQRNQPNFSATSDTFTSLHRLKSFEGMRVCLYGFSEEDTANMVSLLKTYGGIVAALDDPDCTHIVSLNF